MAKDDIEIGFEDRVLKLKGKQYAVAPKDQKQENGNEFSGGGEDKEVRKMMKVRKKR